MALTCWYAVTFVVLWNTRQSADSARCVNSAELAAVLAWAPFRKPAADLNGALVSTVANRFNVDVQFFDNRTVTGINDPAASSQLSINRVSDAVMEGTSGWVSYRVTFRDPTAYPSQSFDGISLPTFL